ncbi:MAG: cell division protein ZapA [Paramuribaculum sp.]|nr:cell division protein ZapA [Paramuribaculum sp.]
MKDKLDINIRIKDITLPVTVSPREEPLLREVAKEVNRVFEEYAKRSPECSDIEILAQVTLLFAKGFVTKSHEIAQMDEFLEGFDSDLDRLLQPGE